MKQKFFIIAFAAIMILTCSSTRSGVGGYSTNMGVDARGLSYKSYGLVPVSNRITYSIDISTPDGKQKLYKLSISEVHILAKLLLTDENIINVLKSK